MVAMRRKTIDEFIKELELRPGEKELLDRLSKWTKRSSQVADVPSNG